MDKVVAHPATMYQDLFIDDASPANCKLTRSTRNCSDRTPDVAKYNDEDTAHERGKREKWRTTKTDDD